jgi:hypothetical protein
MMRIEATSTPLPVAAFPPFAFVVHLPREVRGLRFGLVMSQQSLDDAFEEGEAPLLQLRYDAADAEEDAVAKLSPLPLLNLPLLLLPGRRELLQVLPPAPPSGGMIGVVGCGFLSCLQRTYALLYTFARALASSAGCS